MTLDDPLAAPREHGGEPGVAIARHGGPPCDWIDLSTAIKRRPWPDPKPKSALPGAALPALPNAMAQAACEATAQKRQWSIRVTSA